MWLILCATLGLAEILTRSRGIEGAEQVRVGPIIVRLPYGWKLDSVDTVSGMRAHDPDGQRQLFLVIAPFKRTEVSNGSDYLGPGAVNFKGLHRTGIMEIERHGTDEQDIEYRLVATVAVPSMRLNLRVGFDLSGPEPTGPEVPLLERIAAGITVATGAPRPQIGPPDGNVVFENQRAPLTAAR